MKIKMSIYSSNNGPEKGIEDGSICSAKGRGHEAFLNEQRFQGKEVRAGFLKHRNRTCTSRERSLEPWRECEWLPSLGWFKL